MAQWYYTLNGQQAGPVELDQLKSMVSAGQVQPGDMVWCEGMGAWQPASAVPELSGPGAGSPAYPTQPQAPSSQGQGYPMQGQPVGYQPPTGGYGSQQLGYATGPSSNGMAIGAMICSILGLCCGILGIVGLIMGYIAKGNMRKNGNFEGQGMATAAVVIGWISIVFMIIGIIVQIIAAVSH